MLSALALTFRAAWLVCLLALSPASPLGLVAAAHGADQDGHPVGVVHDAADHAVAPEALPRDGGDRHCLYCQFASSLRLGWGTPRTLLADPVDRRLDWPDFSDTALRTRMRQGLPARAPPVA